MAAPLFVTTSDRHRRDAAPRATYEKGCLPQPAAYEPSAATLTLDRHVAVLIGREPEHVEQLAAILGAECPRRDGEPCPAHLVVGNPRRLRVPRTLPRQSADTGKLPSSFLTKEELPHFH